MIDFAAMVTSMIIARIYGEIVFLINITEDSFSKQAIVVFPTLFLNIYISSFKLFSARSTICSRLAFSTRLLTIYIVYAFLNATPFNCSTEQHKFI